MEYNQEAEVTEPWATYITRFTRAAAFSVVVLGTTAHADTIHMSDLKPIAQHDDATYSVVPASLHEDKDQKSVVVIARKGDSGYALLTVFKCDEHTFAVPVVFSLHFDGDNVIIDEQMTVGPKTAAFTPTSEGPWGAAAEQYACTGKLPVFKPGDNT